LKKLSYRQVCVTINKTVGYLEKFGIGKFVTKISLQSNGIEMCISATLSLISNTQALDISAVCMKLADVFDFKLNEM
jgi:hypothetical protein